MSDLIFQHHPEVTFATNKFINVPVILQYDDTPLISVVRQESLGFTTEIPIYHPDGTYLAKVNGTRMFATEDGKKAGVEMSYPRGMTVCKMDGKTLFEITHQPGDAFKAAAELYTPDGYFVKYADQPMPQVIKNDGGPLVIGGMVMSRNTIAGFRIGVWIKSDGTLIIGSN